MNKNNKSRELFLLFQPDDILSYYRNHKQEVLKAGYFLIYHHTFPNDEPPYIMVTFWGEGSISTICEEDGESLSHYLIRVTDYEKFILLMNNNQRDYCDYYLEGIYTRNAGEHNLSPVEYADGANIRKPKVKKIYDLPKQLIM